ncbi:hypothetical protein [Azotobacter chroococcum]|uniref:hypothetical protein n=1 Tax=Azotobacter chroococcum TaxID=353 RepID=UPI0010AE5CF3|nr:hypothetical protein [Azotobacter chroococcum]TKD30012.1 hypothetical protein FCG41_24360 [Azotobacter chroococcum]
MEQDKVRAEFEAAYMRDLVGTSTEGPEVWLERGSDGEYRSFQARGAWWAWQASREAVVVELPEAYSAAFIERQPEHKREQFYVHNGAVYDCRAAIHAAGIRTK